MGRRRDWLVGQLPMGMLDDDFYVRFVSLFQQVGSGLLDDVDNIANVVDPSVAPVPVLPWLASWLGMPWIDESLPEEAQRRIVHQAGRALAWRGTQRGFTTLLQAVTGDEVVVEDLGSVRRAVEGASAPDPFVRVVAGSTGWLSDEDFVELVAGELPAPVRFEVVAGGRRLWPRADPDGRPSGGGDHADRPSGGGDHADRPSGGGDHAGRPSGGGDHADRPSDGEEP